MTCPIAPPRRTPRERFDPPIVRHRWVTDAPRDRAGFLADTRERLARAGLADDALERVLWHGGIHLDGRPQDLPAAIPAGVAVDVHAFAWEPEPVRLDAGCLLGAGPGWIAAAKPAWLPTQATRATRRLSFEAALRVLTGCADLVAVHRLDRETSGVCLFAIDAAASARLGRAFASGRVRKHYLAVVSPAPERSRWESSGWIGRVLHPRRYAFALAPAPRPGWRWSRTRFSRLAVDPLRGSALVAAEPTTGRTHQLRVHLAATGTPIVGDPVYGRGTGERMLLHAESLELDPLAAGERIALRAPLPAVLALAAEVA
jgi:RNA pseudouridylate synthase